MKIMGVRVSPESIRYAVIEKQIDGSYVFCNKDNDRLVFPLDACNEGAKVAWLWDQFNRVLDIHADVEKIFVKLPELLRGETKASRMSHYLDAVLYLAAAKHSPSVTVEGVNYKTIPTKRSEVVSFVASKGIARTIHYWNEQICDAIAAAIFGLG